MHFFVVIPQMWQDILKFNNNILLLSNNYCKLHQEFHNYK